MMTHNYDGKVVPTGIRTQVTVGDGADLQTHLQPFEPEHPNWRQATVNVGRDISLSAYTPEALEQLADAMLKVAGEMRADRTAHAQREARKDDAINRTTAALDRFVSGQVAS